MEIYIRPTPYFWQQILIKMFTILYIL